MAPCRLFTYERGRSAPLSFMWYNHIKDMLSWEGLS